MRMCTEIHQLSTAMEQRPPTNCSYKQGTEAVNGVRQLSGWNEAVDGMGQLSGWNEAVDGMGQLMEWGS